MHNRREVGYVKNPSEGKEVCLSHSNEWARGIRQSASPKEAYQSLFIPALQLTPHLTRNALLAFQKQAGSV